MNQFPEQRKCSIRIKGRYALKWDKYSYSNTARQRISICFKLAVRGDTGAGGLVAPLPCTAYFIKFAIYCLAVSCPSKRRPSPFVLV